MPDNLKFLQSHEWIDPETGAVGISDHAQSELSDVVYVELPEVGKVVAQGDTVAVVESVKAASDIYAPVGGEVVEVNGELESAPETINGDAFGGGWLFKLKVRDETELGGLLDAEGYRGVIG